MKTIYKFCVSVVLVIILCLITVLPSFAAEDNTITIYNEAQTAFVTIKYKSGYTWEDLTGYRIEIYDEGFVTINGDLLTDGDLPVCYRDTISGNIDYVLVEREINVCEFKTYDSNQVLYSFNYPYGMTWGEFVSYEKEHGFAIKVDITGGTAYYHTVCSNYPLYLQNGSTPGSSSAIIESLTVGSSLAFSVHNGNYTEKITKAADCHNKGEKSITCNDCGYSWTATVAQTEHNFELRSHIDATCTSDGENFYECSICGDSKTEIIDQIEHTYKLAEHTDPTCTHCGEDIYECTACGNRVSEMIDPLGHDLNMFGICKRDGCDYNRFIGGSNDDSNDSTGLINSIQNWFSDIGTTLRTVFRIAIGALGIILFCIVGTYIVRFVRELSSVRKKQ